VAADPTINGHPALLLERETAPPTLLTVCAECGRLRTILFLDRDRWFCTRCRSEGKTAPRLYPVA
jgi:ribosomal protein S27AE